MALVNRIGWSDDRTIETADLTSAQSFASNQSTIPGRLSSEGNGFIFLAVPESTGGIAKLLIGINTTNQITFYPALSAAVDDADGDGNIVHVTLGEQTYLLAGQSVSFTTVNAGATTGLLHVNDLRAALKFGNSTDETVELTRLLAVGSELVNRYSNGSTAPDDIKAEAIIRVCGYIVDSPFSSPGSSYAGAFHNSGARGLIHPWREQRAGNICDAD